MEWRINFNCRQKRPLQPHVPPLAEIAFSPLFEISRIHCPANRLQNTHKITQWFTINRPKLRPRCFKSGRSG
jgi:hypothetical protein